MPEGPEILHIKTFIKDKFLGGKIKINYDEMKDKINQCYQWIDSKDENVDAKQEDLLEEEEVNNTASLSLMDALCKDDLNTCNQKLWKCQMDFMDLSKRR